MKFTNFSFIVLFFLCCAIIGVVSADSSIVGTWQRTDGFDIYDYYADGTCTATEPPSFVPPSFVFHCTWTYDSSTKVYTATWQENGAIDWLTLSADGNSFSGHNQQGGSVSAVRIGTPAPEFPSAFLPATMIIGFLGAVLLIQRTREH